MPNDSPTDFSDAPVNTDLRAMVGHNHCVAGSSSIAKVQKLFQQHRFNFMAVVDGQKVIGMCSRDRIGGLLGSQFGYSIYAKKPIRDTMTPSPEIIREDTPIQHVLDRVFGRSSERFYEDAILVDHQQHLLGLIPVDNLVRLQNSLLSEKILLLETSEDKLIRQKQELERLTLDLERANHELESARDLALEGARLKSEFLANMSHEIRTPMNGIVGMISLLQETELDEEQQQFAETVQRSADALLGIINDILDYSKIEAGRLEVNAEDTPICELIEECTQLLTRGAIDKGVEVILEVDPDVPDWVQLDPLRYRQVLNNLIGNAIKFTHTGEVSIVVDIAHTPERGSMLRTLVRDTGIGIGQDEQKHLFNAFMQADGSTSRKYGGTGLGLAISRKLATLMNGSLEFSSEKNQGSAFWLDLPLVRSAEAGQVAQPHINQGLRALVVDDHPRVREVIAKLMTTHGCEVIEEASNIVALERIQQAREAGTPFDFAFIETENEAVSGVTICEKIRADEANSNLRVVVLSNASNRQMPCCRDIYRLYKPLLPSHVIRLIERQQPEEPAHLHAAAANEKQANDGQSASLRILVAEDMPTNQEVAIEMLERLGHTVYLAENGLQALELLRSTPVDCVLMDCQMPEMDGYACTRAIREGYHGVPCTDIPIIALTAHAMKGDEQKCRQISMNDYLSKPIKLRELAAALDRIPVRATHS